MRAVIQRVKWAKVEVAGKLVGEIGPGLLTLLGVAPTDTDRELDWMIQKIAKLRIFEDEAGKMNLSLLDNVSQGYAQLIVSQFTLLGDISQGNRPSFMGAARPEIAEPLYEKAILKSRALGIKTERGRFGADMKVSLLNDGPVTLVIESPLV